MYLEKSQFLSISDLLAIKKQRTYGKAIIMKRPVSVISNDRTGERHFFCCGIELHQSVRASKRFLVNGTV